MLHADVLGERARLTPDATALVDVATGARVTYRQLDAAADRWARAWQRAGFGPGDRVALLSGNRVEYVELFFGACKAGVVLVPLGTRLTPVELAFVLNDCTPRALVYADSFAETIATLEPHVLIERWVALDRPVSSDHIPAAHLLAAAPATSVERPRLDPESPCCLLYTSGTTGKPKGVIIPHRMVAWNGYNTAISWQLRSDDVTSIFTPLYHAGGLGAFLVPILTIGGTVVLHRGFDATEIWRTIVDERCTVVLGVPTIFKRLAEAPEFATADLSHVRFFISGGAPLPLHIIDAYQARGVVFRQGYGLTEVGVNCFAMTDDDSVRKAGSVGRPLMFTEARLVDEQGHDVSTGDVGELLFRGAHVCAGYWNNAAATAEALDADGWFHTGDLARRDADGFFFIAGRRKDMLISGGVNVYPAEIEGELLLHPAVADAAVVGIPDETWGEVGVAFIVPRPGPVPRTEALAGFLETRLARYKVPKAFILVEALPRTAYGKVVKGELRDRYLAAGRERDPAGSR
jgi:fatty-acyl-CoA synthase